MRFEGIIQPGPRDETVGRVIGLDAVPFGTVAAYDSRHFPAPRPDFLCRWLTRPGGHAIGMLREGALAGFTVSRPARRGHRIGPLFADDSATADALLQEVARRLDGELLQIDVPEVNSDAVALVSRYGLTEVFGCAKMTLGPPPTLPWSAIFGVTTFELG